MFTWDAFKKFVTATKVCGWSRKIFWSFSSILPRSFCWIAFKIWRDRSILPPVIPDSSREPKTRSVALFLGILTFSSGRVDCYYGFFCSCKPDFSLICAPSACYLSKSLFLVPLSLNACGSLASHIAGTWARSCWFSFSRKSRFFYICYCCCCSFRTKFFIS